MMLAKKLNRGNLPSHRLSQFEMEIVKDYPQYFGISTQASGNYITLKNDDAYYELSRKQDAYAKTLYAKSSQRNGAAIIIDLEKFSDAIDENAALMVIDDNDDFDYTEHNQQSDDMQEIYDELESVSGDYETLNFVRDDEEIESERNGAYNRNGAAEMRNGYVSFNEQKRREGILNLIYLLRNKMIKKNPREARSIVAKINRDLLALDDNALGRDLMLDVAKITTYVGQGDFEAAEIVAQLLTLQLSNTLRNGATEMRTTKNGISANFEIRGFGQDSNGNTTIVVKFYNGSRTSIQTNNGMMQETHRLRNTPLEHLTESEIETITREVANYVQQFGSKQAKDSLRVFNGAKRNSTFATPNNKIIRFDYNPRTAKGAFAYYDKRTDKDINVTFSIYKGSIILSKDIPETIATRVRPQIRKAFNAGEKAMQNGTNGGTKKARRTVKKK